MMLYMQLFCQTFLWTSCNKGALSIINEYAFVKDRQAAKYWKPYLNRGANTTMCGGNLGTRFSAPSALDCQMEVSSEQTPTLGQLPADSSASGCQPDGTVMVNSSLVCTITVFLDVVLAALHSGLPGLVCSDSGLSVLTSVVLKLRRLVKGTACILGIVSGVGTCKALKDVAFPAFLGIAFACFDLRCLRPKVMQKSCVEPELHDSFPTTVSGVSAVRCAAEYVSMCHRVAAHLNLNWLGSYSGTPFGHPPLCRQRRNNGPHPPRPKVENSSALGCQMEGCSELTPSLWPKFEGSSASGFQADVTDEVPSWLIMITCECIMSVVWTDFFRVLRPLSFCSIYGKGSVRAPWPVQADRKLTAANVPLGVAGWRYYLTDPLSLMP